MKTLIAYVSRYGTTAECARKLAEKLPGESRLVDLRKERKPDFAGFGTVIIGGPIYAGKIRREITAFCDSHQAEIESRKTGLFICCLYDGEKAQEELNGAYPDWLNAHAAGRYAFGGAIKMSRLNLVDRFLIRKIAQTENDIDSLHPDRIDRLVSDLTGG
jgi:menaquinone-dependent protoporphyrinogen oxidase